ncbi:MAG: transglycosylase domain-containing protein [Fibrobacteria bacterium]|nr:transglycosylase domain-containing protein [Fibrobacteria bacterium]
MERFSAMVWISRHWTAHQALDGILDGCWLGVPGTYGAVATSRALFDRTVESLDLRQVALLAALLDRPSMLCGKDRRWLADRAGKLAVQLSPSEANEDSLAWRSWVDSLPPCVERHGIRPFPTASVPRRGGRLSAPGRHCVRSSGQGGLVGRADPFQQLRVGGRALGQTHLEVADLARGKLQQAVTGHEVAPVQAHLQARGRGGPQGGELLAGSQRDVALLGRAFDARPGSDLVGQGLEHRQELRLPAREPGPRLVAPGGSPRRAFVLSAGLVHAGSQGVGVARAQSEDLGDVEAPLGVGNIPPRFDVGAQGREPLSRGRLDGAQLGLDALLVQVHGGRSFPGKDGPGPERSLVRMGTRLGDWGPHQERRRRSW